MGVSSHSSHHPQEVLLVQFSLYYVHKRGLIPHSFYCMLLLKIFKQYLTNVAGVGLMLNTHFFKSLFLIRDVKHTESVEEGGGDRSMLLKTSFWKTPTLTQC